MTEDELTLERIEEEDDTGTKILLFDKRYNTMKRKRKRKNPPRKTNQKRKRKTKCMWPDCNNNAVSINMCTSCRAKHYNGKILTADPRFFNHEETLELYEDVIEFMLKEDITKEQAVTWLIAEGLNSIEKKEKKK